MTATTDTASSSSVFRVSPVWLFLSGFIATVVFQQGALAILNAVGFTPATPFGYAPRPPLGVPSIWSLAFWGGLWGIVFGFFEKWFPDNAMYWVLAILFGAIAPTLVLWFVVFPIRGQAMAAGWDQSRMILHLLLHGAWGLGTGILVRARA